MDFLQLYLIVQYGHLPETESERICQISGLKSVRGSSLTKSLKNDRETKRIYSENGRVREVVAMRKLTVFLLSLQLLAT